MNTIISAALITLATTGNPADLQSLIGGKVVENINTSKSVLVGDEHYAPPALVVGNTTYRMVAPTATTDNFIIQTGNVIVRLDVGKSEGDNVVRIVSTARVAKAKSGGSANETGRLMISDELVTLATTGDPSGLKSVLGGKVVENLNTDTSVLNGDEHYAPPALVVGGTTYRMVAPTDTTDNFIIKTGDSVVRFDIGKSEGDNVIRVVATSGEGASGFTNSGDSWYDILLGKLGLGDL
ncbi:MAG: hypothetical protein HAW64_05660 [Alphaproteobacteria bacterium]|nr:hypothetical protein [Alphaproteobacteria bacterium]